jgi:hypothetical protein
MPSLSPINHNSSSIGNLLAVPSSVFHPIKALYIRHCGVSCIIVIVWPSALITITCAGHDCSEIIAGARGKTQRLGIKAALQGTYRLMSLNPLIIETANMEAIFCSTNFREGSAHRSWSQLVNQTHSSSIIFSVNIPS